MRNNSFNARKEIFIILNYIKINFINHKFLFLKNNDYSKKKNSNFSTFLKNVLNIFFWSKIRVLYFVNNWIYTTNHKRIAVNYFWFVILSGIVGMVLATLIRLEFAYPGVGIFAGDSLQYLSMATAHGVIMVFFMIMPLLFGAFANFLIPTQLGVHDVAFPRLNSAAFWFLPGGLLMLCQLVCVDRRYQRMNCFNIREIQSILKRRFYTDLINTHDHHAFLDKTAMGLRFKTNSINNVNSNIFVFYNYGIEFTPKIRSNFYFFNNELTSQNVFSFNINSIFYFFLNYFNNYNFFFWFNNFYIYFVQNLTYINSLNLNLKNLFFYFFITINTTSENFFSSIISFFDSFFDSFKLFLKTFTEFFTNINDFFYKLTPVFFNFDFSFYFSFLFYKSLFYDYLIHLYKIYFFYFYSFENSFFSPILNNFNFSQLSLFNLFYEFFFYIKFFEIFYFYISNVSSNFYNYFNYFFLIQYFFTFYNNFFLFFSKYNIYNLESSLKSINPQNVSLENDLFKNSNNFNNSIFFLNNDFYLKINYDSYFVYFFVFFYLIYSLPFLIFSFFKNIFNLSLILDIIYDYYLFLTSWYAPILFKDNIFYYFYRNLNFSYNKNTYYDFNV